ncbi:hypothetical protein QKW60_20515 [Defluviimonas aestuarii]|uniref:hypothetical protein n=1 Tax=Albidovulum aestuarii TaxID=1130726 RepID=UPI00249A7B7F|nr:hypothetical protein [Defluviimonas aestuarii]MDI3338802.1 hypothetical protein [Defluviimonas aestuarii]
MFGKSRRSSSAFHFAKLAFLAPAWLAGLAPAMGNESRFELGVTCRHGGVSGYVSAELCTLFQDRLALAFPRHRIVPDPSKGEIDCSADLIILRSGSSRTEAQIIWRTKTESMVGPLLGTAVADKDIDTNDLALFFDLLIVQTPPPEGFLK